jgi:hypothetical protein
MDPRAGLEALRGRKEKELLEITPQFPSNQAHSIVTVPTEAYVTFVCAVTFKLHLIHRGV